mmetsp:Transcript_88684/g.246278  ORF Transcript_88684/g.246278 Transcript_88684/m.246278 type:complete len:553 (+) Transcript_88684:94-1752(+)
MAAANEDQVLNQRDAGALDGHQALQVLLFLSPRCATLVQATSRSGALAKAAASETLWAAHACKFFGLTSASDCQGPEGEHCNSSWARAFALWHAAAPEASFDALTQAHVQGPLRARWIAVWGQIRRWLAGRAPEVAHTLRPPVRSASLAALAECDLADAQPAVLGLWGVHDGQDSGLDGQIAARFGMRGLEREDEWSLGLLGGYSAYDHEVSNVLLPLHAALKLTAFVWERLGPPSPEHKAKMAFACSHNLNKIFFVDVCDGTVWAWTRQNRSLFELAVPSSGTLAEGSRVRLLGLKSRPELNERVGILASFDDAKERWLVRMEDGSGVHLLKQENIQLEATQKQPLAADGLLRWFEEFARRLGEGMYEVLPLRPDQVTATHSTRGICLFPVSGPEVSRCVTRGVEISASCVYMPEHPQNGWTYSIAFRLVDSASERGYKTCQLHMRHWIIQEEGRDPEHVRGEGVVGFYPVLDDGGWLLNRESDPNQQYFRQHGFVEGPFRYQSCSGRSRSMRGFFSGDLTFIPGTIRQPTGPPFQARLERFRLCVPQYIF